MLRDTRSSITFERHASILRFKAVPLLSHPVLPCSRWSCTAAWLPWPCGATCRGRAGRRRCCSSCGSRWLAYPSGRCVSLGAHAGIACAYCCLAGRMQVYSLSALTAPACIPIRWPLQLPRIVRHLADVGCSPPLDLVNALVAGAVGNGRAATTRELAELVYGLARMGRQVGVGLGRATGLCT